MSHPIVTIRTFQMPCNTVRFEVIRNGLVTARATLGGAFPFVTVTADPIAAKCGVDIWYNGDADQALWWVAKYARWRHCTVLLFIVEGDTLEGELLDRYRDWFIVRGFQSCTTEKFAMIKHLVPVACPSD
jgi:hypothetical protein